jgi:hypothetical protein
MGVMNGGDNSLVENLLVYHIKSRCRVEQQQMHHELFRPICIRIALSIVLKY